MSGESALRRHRRARPRGWPASIENAGAMTEEKTSGEDRSAGLGLAGIRRAVVKRAKAVVAVPILAAIAAAGAVVVVPDRYTASTTIQLDPRLKLEAEADPPALPGTHAFETERLAIDEQIELLRSPALMDRVARDNQLTDDQEFRTPPLFARLSWPLQKPASETAVSDALAAGLSVERVRGSSLVRVRFTSRDPEKAARIANAIAQTYIAEKRADASADASGVQEAAREPSASARVFASMLKDYGLSDALAGGRIVEAAHAPRNPATPKRVRIVAVVTGSALVLMLFLATLLERGARTRPRDVEKMLACPHMTSLPAVDAEDDAEMPAVSARLIVSEPACRYAEAVRGAARELSARANGDDPRVILIASALPGEGAEPFASNIAHHLAVAGQKTLLVDCDFHDKTLTRQLTPQNTGGLLDQIVARAPVENVILRDSLTGVHFLPASGPAPIPLTVPTMLRSVEFSAAFSHLKARFQTIVISAPPLLEQPDAGALAELADQIVFLTAWQRTPHVLARKALALLDANQRKVAGAVLTDVADDRSAGFMSFGAIFDEIRRATGLPSLDRAA